MSAELIEYDELTEPAEPLGWLTGAVQHLADALPRLLDACTDPEAADMAMMLADVQEARIALQNVERDLEAACAKAMTSDQVLRPGWRIERTRATDRKAWEHDEWKRDVRNHAIRKLGLLGATVVSADGEELPQALHAVLATVQDVHGAAAPKTTALKGLGLDARDYCESTPGRWTVRVQRIGADDTEGVSE